MVEPSRTQFRWIAIALLAVVVGVAGCDGDDDDVVNNGAADVAMDVGEDVAQDAAADVAPDVAQDAAPDVAQDVAQDAAPDVAQDVGEDAQPDVTPDAAVAAVEVVDCAAVTAAQSVSMVNIAFSPAEITISAGDVVEWTNDETSAIPHTVTSGNPNDADAGDLFDSGFLDPGDSFCLQFNETGSFEYWCEVHPTQMDDGLVTVQ